MTAPLQLYDSFLILSYGLFYEKTVIKEVAWSKSQESFSMEQPSFYPVGKKTICPIIHHQNSRNWKPIHMMTWFYKNGHISANNGPIWKIQNLAFSGERRAFFWQYCRARRDAWATFTQNRDSLLTWWTLESVNLLTYPFTRRHLYHHHGNQRHGLPPSVRLDLADNIEQFSFGKRSCMCCNFQFHWN